MNLEGAKRKERPSQARCEKFHTLFKSIPKNEVLEYSSSCLLSESSKFYQGRMYISSDHVCFFSKSFFGKASIIIRLKSVITIEITTKILLQQCLNIITYDKTYSFRGVSFKEDAFPTTLRLWQKIHGLSHNIKSIFQVDIPRPLKIVEERTMSEEIQVFNISMRELVKEIANPLKAKLFYKTLTDSPIDINTYMNRRTIQFSNEHIDEIYKPENNMLQIDYHSKGTLCRIYITPKTRSETTVRIIEKYNYTTQHYFTYLTSLCNTKQTKHSTVPIILFYLISLIITILFKCNTIL
ncbi:hypothetical protein NEOKW01_0369 [Nematocida sp. AWRm80]|nr:hypothetical protein NEOKW01_0369 [Nematocida sp. AWRm80]